MADREKSCSEMKLQYCAIKWSVFLAVFVVAVSLVDAVFNAVAVVVVIVIVIVIIKQLLLAVVAIVDAVVCVADFDCVAVVVDVVVAKNIDFNGYIPLAS